MPEFLTHYINVGNSIDSLWNIFMGLHLVLFASILKYGKAMNLAEKLGFIFAYMIFFIMNSRALVANYKLLDEIRKTFIRTFDVEGIGSDSGLLLLMNRSDLTYRIETTIFIHLFGFFIIVYLFFKKSKRFN